MMDINMTRQKFFVIHADRCIGCFTCAMACKNYNGIQGDIAWRQVYPLAEKHFVQDERAFYSLSCNHCGSPVCVSVCPTGAHSKREQDGVVIHDQDKCIGCTNCIRACPFGAPRYNETLRKAEKCSMCWQRLDAGLEPACVQACPVQAITIEEDGSMTRPQSTKTPPGFLDSRGLNPSVRFLLPHLPQIMIMR
jgi:DMSO reductase iron-sulfur subunit